MELDERVRKSQEEFDINLRKLDRVELGGPEMRVVELSKMYASDSRSWMQKGDRVTAFSAIEYAHGLLDAIIKTKTDG